MNELLYYPGFEINDTRWLKFALLYLDNIKTIIPNEADEFISRQYQLIEEETNLLERYRPKFEETEKSSNDTIDLLQKYLSKPERHFGILGKINVVEYWRQQSNQNFELFSSKFSFYFENYCMEYGFGHRTRNGIMIPNQLGLIYMSVLAHNIGSRNNISVITDIEEERSLSSLNRDNWSYNRKFNELKSVKKVIELNLPTNIDDISINDIINFRDKPRYQQRLQSFKQAVNELNNLKDGRLNESNYYEIIKHIEESKAGIFSDLLEFGTTVVQVGLGVTLTLGSGSGYWETIKEVAGAGMVITGAQKVYKRLNEPNRGANKYLTEIRNFRQSKNRLSGRRKDFLI
ncbi:hypothetical protein [Paenibacillus sp. 7523-1]|uniref:hypothetical protein n=1 Tax=Paenibacillus sp. 7523-1 TaxID=2022550 RepID=UPI000BA6D8D8|nr:hypothetical protein [Paenibacillus sp. 7523-1]PAD30042.1 hypothetical protein CHH60_18080 [Paenibacillus sp. 7523-1]